MYPLLAVMMLAFSSPVPAPPQTPDVPKTVAVVSKGKTIPLKDHLTPELPTVFVFIRPASSLEAAFLDQIKRESGAKVGLAAIHLKTGDEPIAQTYQVTQTPTALVFDRRGRLVVRSSDANAILAGVRKAAALKRIDWAEEGDPRLEESRRISALNNRPLSDIMRTMSLRPEYGAYLSGVSQKAHFSDGFLKVRTKEMIATYVSALNKCHFCLGGHAYLLQQQGQDSRDVDAIALLNPRAANISPKEQALLDYVKVLTLESYNIRDVHVEKLRQVGWTDEEIFEASFITSLFSFFNRMANAYDLDFRPDRWLPPDLRESVQKEKSAPSK